MTDHANRELQQLPQQVIAAETTTAAPAEVEEAQQLVEDIRSLRAKQTKTAGVAKLTRKELTQVKAELAAKLFQLKASLMRIGRSGKWSSYLREHDVPISLATADRMVAMHEKLLTPRDEKLLNEEIHPPTQDEIVAYVTKLLPKLAFLTTAESAYWFMENLSLNLLMVDAEDDPRGFKVLSPMLTS